MSVRALLASLTVAALALAGCSDGPAKDPAEEEPEFGVAPTDTTGIIRGVMVDAAVRPLAGVKVTAQSGADARDAVSTADGLFAFEGLAPGTWFLTAKKAGYFEARSSTEVQAGVADPPIVKIQLAEDVANRPYFETYVWHGFIECSAGVPVVQASVNPCFALPTSSNTWNQSLAAMPRHVQAEMVWDPTTAVGSAFLLSAYVPTDDVDDVDGVIDYAEVAGGSPLVLRAGQDVLGEHDVGGANELAFRVFPSNAEPTAFAQQAFDVYIHVFYGYEPPADWQFSADSDVPRPE